MFVYILRRILWMIPTFITISLVVFVIINLAPGTPGETVSADQSETAEEGSSKREAQRMFKEQFNLNKPVLWNTLFWLKTEKVLQNVRTLARQKLLFKFEHAEWQKIAEGDFAGNLHDFFDEHQVILADNYTIEECLVFDKKKQKEYNLLRLYKTMIILKGRRPGDSEGRMLRQLAKKVREGEPLKDIQHFVRQTAFDYLTILKHQKELESGIIPAEAAKVLQEHFIYNAEPWSQLCAGQVPSNLLKFMLDKGLDLSDDLEVKKWLIHDAISGRYYSIIRGKEQFLVYEQREPSPKEMVQAEETLEDYSNYAIAHLIKIALETENEEVRHVALEKFGENARDRRNFRKLHQLRGRHLEDLTDQFDQKALLGKADQTQQKTQAENPAKKATVKRLTHLNMFGHSVKISRQGENYEQRLLSFVNSELSNYNNELDKLHYKKTAPYQERQKKIEAINNWFKEHKNWFDYSTGDKIKIFMLDTRFAAYWWNLVHLDLGISHVNKEPVIEKVWKSMKYSLCLSLVSLLLAYLIAVPIGIYSAVKQNTISDRIITLILFMLYSLPSFFVGTLLLRFFSRGGSSYETLKIFPTGGFQDINSFAELTTVGQFQDIVWHMILPVICLTYTGLASLSRYGRSGVIEVIRSDYIKTARAKGLPEYLVILRHAVRNGMIPILTLLGSVLPVLIGGSIVIEYIFDIQGMGYLTLHAISNRDYNTIMCISLMSAILVMIGILLSDISYALLDPRISFK